MRRSTAFAGRGESPADIDLPTATASPMGGTHELFQIAPLHGAHVAGLVEGEVHSKGGLEGLRRMGAAGQGQVVLKDLAIIGMGAIFDDGVSAGGGILAAQVGHALFGNDDLDRMFAVIQVADQGDDGAGLAGFGGGRAGEDREESVAGKVSRTANAIHDAAAENMRAIDIARDVHLDGGVHGQNAEAAHDFRIVGDFLRAKKRLARNSPMLA